ncbi:hypothetical protein ABZ914_30565 [Spirillospora sp. NPDC046719]
MPDRLEARLAELRQDLATGERRLRDLVTQETALRETLLRISGAIQILDELIAESAAGDDGGPLNGDAGPSGDVLTVP